MYVSNFVYVRIMLERYKMQIKDNVTMFNMYNNYYKRIRKAINKAATNYLCFYSNYYYINIK